MKAMAIGKKAIGAASGMVNYAVLLIIVTLIAFAGYALWDSQQLHRAADKAQYAVYKPTANDEGKSFRELQEINDEVIGWLTVHGTNIDYPITQGDDNMKYVNTSAEGKYSLSGAIFLDYRNSAGFTDFNSILYGHHMAKKVMFGEIGEFSDISVFESRRYGNIYAGGRDHGLEFFAFLHVDAYDSQVFMANVPREDGEAYLRGLIEKAVHYRDIGVTADDRIVLLSTCSADSTNGRDILVARLTDEKHEETEGETGAYFKAPSRDGRYCLVYKVPLWLIILFPSLAALLIISIVKLRKERR